MKTYFSIGRNYSNHAFKLQIDYSLEQVRDTLALNRPEPTPSNFLGLFEYTESGGQLFEDMLANNMGWKILSKRIADAFSESWNSQDIELLPLPEKVVQFNSQLRDYRVLGIKRAIPCVDIEESDI